MSGVYWGLTAMFLMNKQDMMEKDEILQFVQSCQHDNGGFGASQNHDSHLLYTLSAIQVYIQHSPNVMHEQEVLFASATFLLAGCLCLNPARRKNFFAVRIENRKKFCLCMSRIFVPQELLCGKNLSQERGAKKSSK